MPLTDKEYNNQISELTTNIVEYLDNNNVYCNEYASLSDRLNSISFFSKNWWYKGDFVLGLNSKYFGHVKPILDICINHNIDESFMLITYTSNFVKIIITR